MGSPSPQLRVKAHLSVTAPNPIETRYRIRVLFSLPSSACLTASIDLTFQERHYGWLSMTISYRHSFSSAAKNCYDWVKVSRCTAQAPLSVFWRVRCSWRGTINEDHSIAGCVSDFDLSRP